MRRFAYILAILVLVAGTGCDDNVVRDDGPRTDVRTYTLDYSPDRAQINGAVASMQYEVPAISPRVVDEGAVLAYFRDQGTWTAMPYTFGVESPDLPAVDYTVSFGFGYDDRFLEVFYEASTTAVDLRTLPDRTLKIVIIDGFFASKAGVDVTDYDAVKAYYGLPD